MTYNELMVESLSSLLEDGEKLLYPIYGTLKEKKNNCFGYFGLTENYLLIALLQGSSKMIDWTTRVPLDLKKVIVKKCLFPQQYNICIEFNEGENACLRVSKKVYGIESQENNLKGFIEYIRKQCE